MSDRLEEMQKVVRNTGGDPDAIAKYLWQQCSSYDASAHGNHDQFCKQYFAATVRAVADRRKPFDAQKEYDEATPIPISDERIDEIVKSVMSKSQKEQVECPVCLDQAARSMSCPECGTMVVRCTEAGVEALDRLATDRLEKMAGIEVQEPAGMKSPLWKAGWRRGVQDFRDAIQGGAERS